MSNINEIIQHWKWQHRYSIELIADHQNPNPNSGSQFVSNTCSTKKLEMEYTVYRITEKWNKQT